MEAVVELFDFLKGTKREPEPSRVGPETQYYALVAHTFSEGDGYEADGAGYVVQRASDGVRLFWDDLPAGMYAFSVAGVSFRKTALQRDVFNPGKELMLVPEPDNPHSKSGKAVAVWDAKQRTQLGYVPDDESGAIFDRLQSGEQIRCISMMEFRKGHARVGLSWRSLVTLGLIESRRSRQEF